MPKLHKPEFVREANGRFYWEPSKQLRAKGYKGFAIKDSKGNPVTVRADAYKLIQEQNWKVQHEQADEDRRNAASRGRGRDDPELTVADMLNDFRTSPDWRHSSNGKRKSERTLRQYDYCARMIEREFGSICIHDLDRNTVNDRMRALELQGAHTARAVLRFFKIALNWAVDQGIIVINPLRRLTIEAPKRDHELLRDELWPLDAGTKIAAVADAHGAFSLGTMAVTMEWLGAYPVDFCQMSRSAYDQKRGRILYDRVKTGVPARLWLQGLPHVKERLDRQLAYLDELGFTEPTDPLLVSEHTLRRFTVDGLRGAWNRLQALCAQPDGCPEIAGLKMGKARHTVVTRLFAAGWNVQQIVEVTGHEMAQAFKILKAYRMDDTQTPRDMTAVYEAAKRHAA